ncbi:hypothetical protein DYB36_006915 [Aphanomyces astaci]|uniref:WRKY19-like zinc finger domain-containing protein n=1 Tax=Aphanomyces astaci TaxID=112090 RepID=A0A397F6P3_APHAT|nr:hypothetical protein DYB36_006915 [Aphanomyces astaci]RHZ12439.1 hypothetical protein DYB31_013701 [Aphanomyces astaci]
MVKHCPNQVYARKLCVKHGGKQQCQADGCDANARRHGFCCKHVQKPVKKPCLVEGCVKFAHSRRFCAAHGGSRKCRVDACSTFARTDGVCHRHRALLNVHCDKIEPRGAGVKLDSTCYGGITFVEMLVYSGESLFGICDKAYTIDSVDLTTEDSMILDYLLM